MFDGCHMFGLALRNVGMECAGTADIEKHPRAVTRYHYPDTPQLGDVRDVTPGTVEPFDLLVGGWPCQGNSVAGDLGGLADERSGLFGEIVRIARTSDVARSLTAVVAPTRKFIRKLDRLEERTSLLTKLGCVVVCQGQRQEVPVGTGIATKGRRLEAAPGALR